MTNTHKLSIFVGSLLLASAGVAQKAHSCFTTDDVPCQDVFNLNYTRVCISGQVADQCQDLVGSSSTYKRVRGADIGETGNVDYTSNECQNGEAEINLGSCSGLPGSQICEYAGWNVFTCPSLCLQGASCSGAVAGGVQ